MDPVDLSACLRSVADRLDASCRPSLSAVSAELGRVLSALAGGTVIQNTCSKCGERHVGDICPTCGTHAGPQKVSSALRSISERILNSRNPSRSAVAAELRRVLVAMGQVSSGLTKVVVSDFWTLDEVKALAPEFGGTDIRTGPYGDVGLVVPADKVDAVQEGGGEFHVFDSWEEVSGGDPEFAFEPDDAGQAGVDVIEDLFRVKPGKSDVREYLPVGKDSPYAVIDGRFEFTLPDGQHCVWDGRLDHDNVDGTLTVDGEDMTAAFLQGDTPGFGSIDPSLDPGVFDLESVLGLFVKK